MQVSVLGSVGVRQDGTDVELGTRLRRLLAGLAVSNGSVVSTDRLVEIVWADRPTEGAAKTLRSYVTRLRRALDSEDQRIVFREPGYVIDLETWELDSASFDDELDRALQLLRAADATAAGRLLEDAVARWRGPAYAGKRRISIGADVSIPRWTSPKQVPTGFGPSTTIFSRHRDPRPWQTAASNDGAFAAFVDWSRERRQRWSSP